MPKNNIDYSKTIIYKIVCKDINIKDCYIGSTTNFTNRKQQHKNHSQSNIKSHLKVYVFINQNGGWENWEMIEIEKYNAIDHNDALKRERYFLEELKATLNKIIPSRTKEEYSKEYNKVNEEKLKEYRKEYNKEKITCECGCIINKDHLARHKKTLKHEELLNQQIE